MLEGVDEGNVDRVAVGNPEEPEKNPVDPWVLKPELKGAEEPERNRPRAKSILPPCLTGWWGGEGSRGGPATCWAAGVHA